MQIGNKILFSYFIYLIIIFYNVELFYVRKYLRADESAYLRIRISQSVLKNI